MAGWQGPWRVVVKGSSGREYDFLLVGCCLLLVLGDGSGPFLCAMLAAA